jgi:hypothetical protein
MIEKKIDIDIFVEECLKLSLSERERLYLMFSGSIVKHFDRNNPRFLTESLISMFLKLILPEYKTKDAIALISKKTEKNLTFDNLSDAFWKNYLIWIACLLLIALDFRQIKDSGFPFGIGGLFLSYIELAKQLGKYQINNLKVFFDEVKIIGVQLLLIFKEIYKL